MTLLRGEITYSVCHPGPPSEQNRKLIIKNRTSHTFFAITFSPYSCFMSYSGFFIMQTFFARNIRNHQFSIQWFVSCFLFVSWFFNFLPPVYPDTLKLKWHHNNMTKNVIILQTSDMINRRQNAKYVRWVIPWIYWQGRISCTPLPIFW